MFIDFIIKSTDTFPDAFLNAQDTAVENTALTPFLTVGLIRWKFTFQWSYFYDPSVFYNVTFHGD